MKRVTPKKYLGQHFLKDQNIAKKITESLSTDSQNVLLEVGPGTGVLTQHLLDRDRFFAFDVDKESIDFLMEQYPDHKDCFLFKDFLKTDLQSFGDHIDVIGNFPYNISSQLFFKIYDNRQKVRETVCMIQKEVADRIAANEGSKTYGILSVLLQAFYDVEYLFTVKPGVFNPPPKVNSAVLKLTRNKREELPCDEILFKKVVKMGFNQRRKTLRNALRSLDLQLADPEKTYMSQRAEQLSVEQFIDLTTIIERNVRNS